MYIAIDTFCKAQAHCTTGQRLEKAVRNARKEPGVLMDTRVVVVPDEGCVSRMDVTLDLVPQNNRVVHGPAHRQVQARADRRPKPPIFDDILAQSRRKRVNVRQAEPDSFHLLSLAPVT